MKNTIRWLTAALLSATTLCATAQEAPIRILVGFSPGGAADSLARVVATNIGADLKTTVVVENKPGANGNIAAEAVATAPADGTTLYMGSFNNPVNQAAGKKLPFDFMRDFAPVAMVAYVPNVLVVNNALPAQNVKELVTLARQKPGQLSFGSAGPGSSLHMAGELFKRAAQVDLLHAPYKGSAPAIADLLGGHIDMMFDNLSSALPMVRAGKVRALAVTSPQRQKQLPEVPTVDEAGLPGYSVVSFFALFARTGTPPVTVQRINAAVNAALARPEVLAQLDKLGAQAAPETPAQLRSYTQAELRKWQAVIEQNHITLD